MGKRKIGPTMTRNFEGKLTAVEGVEALVRYWDFHLKAKKKYGCGGITAPDARDNLLIAWGNMQVHVFSACVESCWGQYECDMRLLARSEGDEDFWAVAQIKVEHLREKLQLLWELDSGWEDAFTEAERFHVIQTMRFAVDSPKRRFKNVYSSWFSDGAIADLDAKGEEAGL